MTPAQQYRTFDICARNLTDDNGSNNNNSNNNNSNNNNDSRTASDEFMIRHVGEDLWGALTVLMEPRILQQIDQFFEEQSLQTKAKKLTKSHDLQKKYGVTLPFQPAGPEPHRRAFYSYNSYDQQLSINNYKEAYQFLQELFKFLMV